MIEIWKPIEGYEGLYEVSNLGRVRSTGNCNAKGYKGKIKILKPSKQGNGYLIVSLCKDNKKRTKLVHRLVGFAFIPNDNPKYKNTINHINEDKTDNRACNLEWCSQQYNNTYNNRNWKAAAKRGVKVNQFTLNGKFIKEWPSQAEIERTLHLRQSDISACCTGKQKTAFGFIWKYAS